MKDRLLNGAIIMALACGLAVCHAQAVAFERGTILDSIGVADGQEETFALYLPQGYDPAVPAPVVFIFDPAARGRHAVEFFIPSAEHYGYILVCSNKTRNGPYQQNFAIANRLFTEIFSRFRIDPNRVYTAGFSGGSRLAASIAILTKQIQGVVACGAGLASGSAYLQLSEPYNFSYAGMVGNQDMNYREMINTRNWLSRLNVRNELFQFASDHQWPPPEEVLVAFDWLQLEVFRKGLAPVDTQQVRSIYEKYARRVRDLEASGEQLRAYEEYARLVRNFGPYVGLEDIVTRQWQLVQSKDYRKAKQAWEACQAMEDTLVNRYSDRLYRDIPGHSAGSQAWWYREIGKLEAKRQKADPERRRMLQRVLNTIWAMAHQRATDDAITPEVLEKAFCLDLCIRLQPEAPIAYFLQMENYIRGNDFDTALDYLERLLETGYANTPFIRSYRPLDPVRGMERYKALIPE